MSRRRLMPNRTSQRPTVATDTTCPRPRSSRAIWRAVHLSLRRHVSIWVTRSGSSWVGDRCGTLARSARPTSPSSSNRAFHFDKHWRETPASAATCAIGRWAQRRTRRPLPAGVNGALAWDMTGLLGSDELLALHILSSGTWASILVRNFLNSTARWRRWMLEITVPSAVLNAANKLVVPWRT